MFNFRFSIINQEMLIIRKSISAMVNKNLMYLLLIIFPPLPNCNSFFLHRTTKLTIAAVVMPHPVECFVMRSVYFLLNISGPLALISSRWAFRYTVHHEPYHIFQVLQDGMLQLRGFRYGLG